MRENSVGNNTSKAGHHIIPNGKPHDYNDEIVITGFSGRLPESTNIQEFKQQLFDGVNLVTDDERRWPSGHYGLSTKGGKLKDLSSFDATFFGVHAKQADVMDPQMRLLLEATYEAIVDAGINPSEIRGSKTGVYIGVTYIESTSFWQLEPDLIDGYKAFGSSRTMLPNRISYTFDFKGPSTAVQSACSSSFTALNQAVDDIRSGHCDAAIVGGVNLTLDPITTLQYFKLNMLSPDGHCKSFDASGNGYVRSEAVVSMFLQKSRNAKRVYATIVHSKTNTDGYKALITYPSGNMQNELMRELYLEAGIDPTNVAFMEAHGPGTEAGDVEEVNAIADLFCKNRKEPLLIGSVKSNIGHTEPVSGLCSVIKVLLAMEAGVIPGNLHFKIPNPNMPALSDGRLKVVDRPMPWNGGFVGINSFGAGGTNVHVLLRSNQKQKLAPLVQKQIPKIVAVSGRTEEAVNTFLDKVKENEHDDEFLSLVQDLHALNIEGHGYRGFQILGSSIREIEEFNEQKRPVWYVFSGNGSQWSGMGQTLLSIDVVQKSLQRCASALKPEGVDLMKIILSGTNETFENVVNSYVSITSIQIALVDLLSQIGIQPEGLIGHSVGELACAYADGTLTIEQTVLSSYWRAKLILESNLSKGAMAAVGLSWEETQKRCPPDIFLACHNSDNSVTVSGPTESVAKFIKQLKKEEIFAQEVQSCGIAFHSKYIASVGPKLRDVLEKIIPNSKRRTARWISSSISKSKWNTELAQFSSPAYFVNNFLFPVLFKEALTHVPDNAIIIEVAPHALFQAVLRRALPPTVTKIGLQNRNHSDNLSFLLTSIGKFYISGGQPKLSKLYPPITYPVGRGTPMINSIVQWDHSSQWSVPDFSKKSKYSGQNTVEIDLSRETDAYIAGHSIADQIIFPVSGYLKIVWKTFAGLRGRDFEKTPVVFEEVQIHRPVIIEEGSSVKFVINILEGTGTFEISESGSSIVTGKICSPAEIEKEELNLPLPVIKHEPELLPLKKADVYKDLRIRGYNYSGNFQNIQSSDNRGLSGKLGWSNDWNSFLDSLFQFIVLGKNNREPLLPTRLDYVAIKPALHKQLVERSQSEGISVYNFLEIGIIKAGGVILRGINFSLSPKPKQTQADPTLEKYVFVPFEKNQSLEKDQESAKFEGLCALLQVARENIGGYKIRAIEATEDRNSDVLLAPLTLDILDREPMLSVDLKLFTSSPEFYTSVMEEQNIQTVVGNMQYSLVGHDLHLILVRNILQRNMLGALKNLEASLKPGGFILSEETTKADSSLLSGFNLEIVAQQSLADKSYVLLKKDEGRGEPIIIRITERNFLWLEELKASLRTSEKEGQRILIVSEGEELIGLAGFMNCLRLEPGGLNTHYFFIQDKNVPKFSLNDAFYMRQLKKDLSANVLKDGVWGTYRHLRILDTSDKPVEVEEAYMDTLVKGNWNTLQWIERPLQYYQLNKSLDQELCHVYYAGLNSRDTGKLNLDDNLANQDGIGIEFAGRDSAGRRLMGLVPTGGISTTVLTDPFFTWEVPEKWTLKEAATIPVPFATSYYALIVRGQLCKGKSVLIHDGSSVNGQASIAIALHASCSVLTTVNSQEERNFLKKRFPQLGSNILNCQEINFEELVLHETQCRGVDLVLNSPAEEKIQASICCLAKGGHFEDIDLNLLFHIDSSLKKEIARLISEGIKRGVVRPLPAVVFPYQKIEEGFKLLSSRHCEKVLIKIRDEFQNPEPGFKIKAIRRTYLNPKKSYLLVGGLGGFGLELANWMITRGARNIILTSRSGIQNGYQALCIRRWREIGVRVQVSTISVTTEAEAESLLKETMKLGPVGGIFNLAAVIQEALIENLDEGNFKAVTLPKIDATKSLDSASKKYCPGLEYFICFSSNASGRGNGGQTNYALANSAMERMMEQRRALGLPGLAIQWGPIGDVGIIAETMGSKAKEVNGKYPQRISSCLRTIDFFLQQPYAVLGSMVIAERQKTGDSSTQMNVTDAVAKILEVKDLKTVNMNKSLPELGMDSMMGTEIKNTLEKNYDLFLSLQEVRALTFGKLVELSSKVAESIETI